VAIAWVGALVADLLINKSLGLSPPYIEFKRAHLYNINPVGVGSTLIASLVAMIAFVGFFGPVAKAFAAFISLGLALILAPAIALITRGRYYIARPETTLSYSSTDLIQCCICRQYYEAQDMAVCPAYDSTICSLCCTLDARCNDICKHVHSDSPGVDLEPGQNIFQGTLSTKLSPQLGSRLLRFLSVAFLLSTLAGIALGCIYYQQVTSTANLTDVAAQHLTATLVEVYAVFIVLIGIGSWWLVLTQESRQLAQEELDKQNLQLQQEVTERQLAETQLQEKAEQLEQTLSSLQQAENQLIQTEKMAALGRLVAGIAHEINTPIGIGVTATSLLTEKTDAFSLRFKGGALKRSELEKFLSTAQQSSQMALKNLERAAELIQSFKRVAVDQSSESKRVFNVKSYLEEILLQLSPKLKATQHTVIIQGDATLDINSFPGAFSQIVTNLVMNSLLHAYNPDDRGVIKLDFQGSDRSFVFFYTDDGKGIPAENLSKIFEPFFTTKRGQGGSGLGLHIVYNLVTRKLDGSIRCESQWGKGTQFTIELPLA
ncbi:MAG: HAMP domain-containing sensor histidine kinase, partial [Cyanobacteria bacterium P01_F01_bin.86]